MWTLARLVSKTPLNEAQLAEFARVGGLHQSTGLFEASEVEAHLFFNCASEDLSEFVSAIQTLGAGVEVTLEPYSAQNWVAACEDLLEPLELGQLKLLPVRTREEAEQLRTTATDSTLTPLYLIPGNGFGTGHHPTTCSLIELLQSPEVSARMSAGSNPKVLDLGTGSGILAIACHLLYPHAEIVAIDNDPLALQNLQENLQLNPSVKLTTLEGTMDAVSGTFDIVLANIYAEILIEVEDALFSHTNSNSCVLLSGIHERLAESVDHTYASRWIEKESRQSEEWHSRLLVRNTSS